MIITWYGQSFFDFKTKDSDKEIISLAIDPFGDILGLKIPKIEAQILLITHDHSDHNNVDVVKGNPFLITEPGEYEIKNIFIKGIQSFHDDCQGQEKGINIIYKFNIEGMQICHLGNLGQKELNEQQLEEIGKAHILIISVAGPFTNAKHAASIVSQIEPEIIIPMHYNLPDKSPELKSEIDELDKFLKLMGAENIEPQKKLKIELKDIDKIQNKIIVLEH